MSIIHLLLDELLKLVVIGYIEHGVFSYLQNENVDTVWPGLVYYSCII